MSTIQDCLAGRHTIVVKGPNMPRCQWMECTVCGMREDENGVVPGAKFLEAQALAELQAKAEAGEIAPSCRTCPLLCGDTCCYEPPKVFTHLPVGLSDQMIPLRPWVGPNDFCSRHPLYPFWAMGECLRRVREVHNETP